MGRWQWLVAVLALGLSGCGTKKYDVGPFESYVRIYRAEAVRFGKSGDIPELEIAFGQVSEELQGYCTFIPSMSFDGLIRFDLVPTIYIDKTEWENNDDEYDREALIMHELGHCLLARPHDSRLKEESEPQSNPPIPRSVMYPVKLEKGVYQANRDYYLNELFNPPSGAVE